MGIRDRNKPGSDMALAAAKTGRHELTELSDLEIASLVADGDREAFHVLFTRYHGFVRRVVLSTTRQADDLDDIVQDVFIRLFAKCGTYRGESSFSTWMYRMVVNAALDNVRKNRRRADFFVPWSEELQNRIGARGFDTILKNEKNKKVYQAIQHISDKRRPVFVLFELEGMSLEETGKALDLPTTTVWSRLNQARKEFGAAWKRITGSEGGDV